MTINPNNVPGTAVPTKTDHVQSLQPAAGTDGKAKTGGASGDRVEISSLTGQLSQALGAPDTSRAAYVSRITEAVRSGKYQVDSAAISRNLVDEALSRSGGRQ
jgi:flagellar biosynthesis anti-sigma factor FlgM